MTTQTTPRPPQAERTDSARPAPPRRPVNHIWIVLRKELREIFRDNRTIFAVIISPLLITPLMMALLGTLISKQMTEARKETITLGIVGARQAPALDSQLRGAPGLQFEEVTRAEAERQIKERKLRAAAVLPPDAQARMQSGREVPITILLDQGSDSSRMAAGRLQELLRERAKGIVAERLKANGLSPDLAIPFRVTEAPIAGGGTPATMMLAMFLPYILVLSAVVGGLHAANDLVAGEKERGTLETLLVAPASRRDLVMGKFLAVATVCLINSLLSIVGLMIPFFVPLDAFGWLAQGGLKLSAAAVLVMFVVQLPLAVLGAGLLLAISTFARNQKESQTYLTPLLLAVTVPAMMSMFLKTESSWPLALVPILNAAMVLKQALTGVFNPLFIVLAFGASIAYAALAVLFATRLFQRESVLLKA